MTLSLMIQAERKRRGMTIAELAEQVGYDPSHFALLERGVRKLDEEAAVKVATVLGLDPTKAIMAAVRERLPEALRGHLPTRLPKRDVAARHAVARELQAETFDFEIKLSKIRCVLNWDGTIDVSRTLEECRPNASMRPVSEIVFREQAVGSTKPDIEVGSFTLVRAPKSLVYRTSVTRSGSWLYHKLFFPEGWRRKTQQKDDAFSFSLASHHEWGLDLSTADHRKRVDAAGVDLRDPAKGSLNVWVGHNVKRLEFTLELPSGYEPQLWESWVSWGREDFEASTHDVRPQACRSLIFNAKRNVAKLVVEEPLAGYRFIIRWLPLSHQSYLEARDASSG